eukprot:CAMPEP_0197030156 /NCGR_PEP_ID=MMETSP1384-20130603/9440_1 /TAXON_ID=29189 /ORGANISM="Ammonia sp." /LENGTH=209 /DNA_ID=CAMNT_0042459447 /DNA_START=164 /DNA_END=793 /DNA_ORIENTATION=+
MHKYAILLIIVLCFISGIESLYWLLPSNQEKCFLEEIPAETLVVVTYKSLDHALLTNEQGLFAVIRDPFDNVVSQQALTESEGRVAFSSEHAGDHRVCFGVNGDSGENREYKMEIHIDSGDHAHDYDKLARVEHLSTIEVELRRLNDKIRAIRNEQQYQKQREEEFRNTSENTNYKVVVWSIIQTVVLIACGLFQIWHLKQFFTSKKLV